MDIEFISMILGLITVLVALIQLIFTTNRAIHSKKRDEIIEILKSNRSINPETIEKITVLMENNSNEKSKKDNNK